MTVPLKVVKAARGASKSAPGRRGGGAVKRTAPLPRQGTEARRQRDAIDAIKAKREDPEPTEPAPELEQQPASPPPASPGGGPSMPAMPAAASTGSGFLLGVFVWAAGLAYLEGGSAGVRKFLAAKFLNKT